MNEFNSILVSYIFLIILTILSSKLADYILKKKGLTNNSFYYVVCTIGGTIVDKIYIYRIFVYIPIYIVFVYIVFLISLLSSNKVFFTKFFHITIFVISFIYFLIASIVLIFVRFQDHINFQLNARV